MKDKMEPVSRTEFGVRLRDIRHHLDLKQTDFATRMGTSPNVISEIENGKYKPGFDMIGKFASVFNINLYYLFFGKGEMFIDLESNVISPVSKTDLLPEAEEFIDYFFNSRGFQYRMLSYFYQLKENEIDLLVKKKKD